MKSYPIVAATLLGVAVYFSLELLFGSTGFIAHQALEEYHGQVSADLERVRDANAELQRQIDRLRSDPEEIRIVARDVGLVEPDERIIRIEGRDRFPRQRLSPGPAVREAPRIADNRPLFRAIGLATTLVFLLAHLFSEPLAARRRRRQVKRNHGVRDSTEPKEEPTVWYG